MSRHDFLKHLGFTQTPSIMSIATKCTCGMSHNTFCNPTVKQCKQLGVQIGVTEYATKLHMAQRVIEKVDTKLLSAIDLLREVFQKHESGLLPDRFVYDKIKKFLYGE
jgi:hypothetical protein